MKLLLTYKFQIRLPMSSKSHVKMYIVTKLVDIAAIVDPHGFSQNDSVESSHSLADRKGLKLIS